MRFTIRELRRLPGLDCAVLVAVTGYGQEEDRRRTRDAGFDHYWVKPANLGGDPG
jgi:CheY-like chemotaxis protein